MRSSRLRFADSSPERPAGKRIDGFKIQSAESLRKKQQKSSSNFQICLIPSQKTFLFLNKLEVIMVITCERSIWQLSPLHHSYYTLEV